MNKYKLSKSNISINMCQSRVSKTPKFGDPWICRRNPLKIPAVWPTSSLERSWTWHVAVAKYVLKTFVAIKQGIRVINHIGTRKQGYSKRFFLTEVTCKQLFPFQQHLCIHIAPCHLLLDRQNNNIDTSFYHGSPKHRIWSNFKPASLLSVSGSKSVQCKYRRNRE